jgi:phosphate transport system substrate-binding protein
MTVWKTAVLMLLAGALLGCSDNPASTSATEPAAEPDEPAKAVRPVIAIDGSSTVFPVTEAVAEEFQKQSDARVTIGISGTGGGFKKFCRGETVVTGVSRPIKPTELDLCARSGIEYIELPVAYDGISVVVHPDNDWAKSMTVDQLKKMWEPKAQGVVTRWNQVDPSWPDKELHLFGPGVDSGTYDYFTEAIVGMEHSSRGDFTSSEDDNVLVHGVSTDPLALGFFGHAYYVENENKLRLVSIDDGIAENGKGPVLPSMETVENGTYQPLSRPIFIYVNRAAADRPQVREFVKFYLTEAEPLVRETGYMPLPAKVYALALKRFEDRVPGTVFGGEGARVGVTVEQLLAAE